MNMQRQVILASLLVTLTVSQVLADNVTVHGTVDMLGAETYPEDDAKAQGVYYVAVDTAEVLHGIGKPMGVTSTEKEDILHTHTTDGGSTWLRAPWVINPNSSSPDPVKQCTAGRG